MIKKIIMSALLIQSCSAFAVAGNCESEEVHGTDVFSAENLDVDLFFNRCVPEFKDRVYGNWVPVTEGNVDRDKRIAALSAEMESNGKGSVISTGHQDPYGGQSYGHFQIASKTGTMGDFLKSKEGKRWAGKLRMPINSKNFKKDWKWLSTQESTKDAFYKSQFDFLKRTHFSPVKHYLTTRFKVSSLTESELELLDSILFSAAIQHGVGHTLKKKKANTKKGYKYSRRGAIGMLEVWLDTYDLESMTFEQLVKSFYSVRYARVKSHVANKGLRARYNREVKVVLKVLKEGDDNETEA